MLAIIPSATVLGARGLLVQVEVHVSVGLPGVNVVGLPDTACREGVHRLSAAFRMAGLEWPAKQKKLVVNLAPPGIPKLGSGMDLAIAIGALVSSDQLPLPAIEGMAFLGELGLDGTLRSVPGIVPMVATLAEAPGVHTIVVPAAAHHEAAVAGAGLVRSATRLQDLLPQLDGGLPWCDP
ncbi:MAG: hypothetical protein H0W25_05550, partial [Acidimicrobiia bacterium]|nr:hypothetical protein [Acidimicrobiia bacterium]